MCTEMNKMIFYGGLRRFSYPEGNMALNTQIFCLNSWSLGFEMPDKNIKLQRVHPDKLDINVKFVPMYDLA